MASLGTHQSGNKAGSRYIRFFHNRERRMIYLGKIPERIAETILRYVEDLIAAKAGGVAVTPATSKWLTTIDDALADKLADVGLIEPRVKQSDVELDAFVTSYIDGLSVKAGTRFNLHLARRNLVEFFGAKKPLTAITPGDADEWRRWLANKFEANTVRRRCGRAKQFFRAAVRKKLIAESPFADMKDCKVNGNRERDYFVTREEAQKVLDACPDTQWRLLFALSRYAGLRCPSEHAQLKWADVDWTKDRMTVRSPKTEHHDGHESREVPIFPELRPYLEAAKTEAGKDAEYVITIQSVVNFRAGAPSPNFHTRMTKIVKRAGLKPWPKLFHNLRATRQTELTASHPEHVVCQWLGNTQSVAREHYLRVTDADFAKATAAVPPGEPLGEPSGKPLGATKGSLNGNPPDIAGDCLLLQTVRKALEDKGLEQVAATLGNALREYEMTPRGLEPLLPP